MGLIKSGLLPTLKSFNFKNVYIIRKSIHLDSITAYLIGITTRVVIPFLLCINYSRKKYKKIFMLIILQLIIYSMYPFKSILFSLGLVIIVINGVKSRNFFKNFIYTLIVLCMVSIILELFSNDGILTILFIRRSLFVPVNIQFDYNNFFTNNPYLYMSNNSIGSILGTEYPYRLPIVNLISAIYYNDPRMAANTCYISESYAQLGYLGMLLYSAIFILINRCLDCMVLKVDKSIIIPTIIIAIYALNDASLLTTMLTHGLIPGMLIIYMYMGTEDCKNKLIE
ncbi:MAG: hypothetical protein ACLVIU_13070 [Paraclostridium sp.]